MKLSVEELNSLRDELKGLGAKVAASSGSSRQAVHCVLNGVYYNKDIINAAIKLRNKLRKQKDSLVNKLKG